MATFSAPLPQMSMTGKTVQQQKQIQRMSQQQILSLKLLAMGSLDLRESIYSQVEKNPALEITHDRIADGVLSAREKESRFSDNTRYGSANAAGIAASDAFQAALENATDTRETLQEHLEHQFNAMPHTKDEEALGLALIRNLDASGFHILAPFSLLDKSRPQQNEQLLQTCLSYIRALDPVGTCCSGVEESLLVQAQLNENAPKAALFLLEGHLPFLNPPQAEKVLKKIDLFLAERRKLSFISEKERYWLEETEKHPFTLQEIADAIAFIKSLDPYPARNFGSAQTQFIAPDVYVEKIPLAEDEFAVKNEAQNSNTVSGTAHSFKITLANGVIPQIAVSKDFEALAQNVAPAAAETESGRKFAQDAVRDAKVFIDSIQFRENTIARATFEIVRAQLAFFEGGARYLVPLRQKDIAEKLGVHEATISRMASSKYLQCEWGLFELGYFFTNAVGSAKTRTPPAAESKTAAAERQQEMQNAADEKALPAGSKEAVKFEIAAILKLHEADKKPLSDQKIADLLSQKGIQIARRTVAKYRAELNINSSYSR